MPSNPPSRDPTFPSSIQPISLGGRQRQAEVLLVTVSEVETRAVFDALTATTGCTPVVRPFGDRTYYDLGVIGNARVWLVRSEQGASTPGGAFATLYTAIWIVCPVAILMVGTAVGLNPDNQRIGDILIARQLVAYEPQRVGTLPNGEPVEIPRGDRATASPLALDRCRDAALHWSAEQARVQFGLMLSGEKLLEHAVTAAALRAREPEAIGGEMEGVALYAAALQHKLDWIVIKAIAHWPERTAVDEVIEQQALAAHNAAAFALHVLARGGFASETWGLEHIKDATHSTVDYAIARKISRFYEPAERRKSLPWKYIILPVYVLAVAIVFVVYVLLPSFRQNALAGSAPCEPDDVGDVKGLHHVIGSASFFTTDTTRRILPNNNIRHVLLDGRNGIWFAYDLSDQNPSSGVGHFDNETLVICKLPAELRKKNINSMVMDHSGRLLVAVNGAGIAVLENRRWSVVDLAKETGSSDDVNDIYSLYIESYGRILAGTRKSGVFRYNNKTWDLEYTSEKGDIKYNDVQTILVDDQDIWFGHNSHGVSRYNIKDRTIWYYDTKTPGFGGLRLSHIVALTIGDRKSLWFSTTDAGVMRFENNQWKTYTVDSGLPSNNVRSLAIDKDKRIWAATDKGVAYFDVLNEKWVAIDSINTYSIAFGMIPDNMCQGKECDFTTEHIWQGTDFGIAHRKIPYRTTPYTFKSICFRPLNTARKEECLDLDTRMNEDIIVAEYSEVFVAGEQFRTYITAIPNANQVFANGDLLRNLPENPFDASSRDTLFGTWPHMAVEKFIDSGEVCVFENEQNPFRVPELEYDEQRFTSKWRLWLNGRYVGPELHIVFKAKR